MFFNFNVNFFLFFLFVNVLFVLFRNLEITDQSFNIVDIKPENMEELTEVITASCFHPTECNLFMYSSSRGCIKLGKLKKNQKLTRLEWEKNTEAIDMEYLAQFKCDVLLFSVGNDSVTEVAVYNADRIGSIQRKTDRRTAEELFMEELQRNKDQDNLCQMIDSRINAALQDSELEFLDEPMARMPRQENGRYATAPKRRCVMQ